MKLKIIISYYSAREPDSLIRLLNELSQYQKNILVSINHDENFHLKNLSLNVPHIFNQNVGMNIGAWHHGYKHDTSDDLYVFLQDECFLKNHDFLNAAIKKFESDCTLAMLGETINRKWAQSWNTLSRSPLNSLENDHYVDGHVSTRVQCYVNAMQGWNINPGDTGEHLRSLVWMLPGKVMRQLEGFPIGGNRGECIAAEIAVSRKIVSLGYKFDQIAPMPFSYFGHCEWRSDGASKLTVETSAIANKTNLVTTA